MIDQVLELIVEGRIIDKREIAKQIGIQVETLNDMIDLLCKRGYLRASEQSCTQSPQCSGCSIKESCGSTDKYGRVLFITEKGKKYVKTKRERKRE